MATDSVTPQAANLPEGYSLVDHTNVPEGYTLTQPPSMLESAARGAEMNVPMLPQIIATQGPKKYSAELADLKSKAGIAKAANPVSYGAGAVTGAIAPMFIPGVGQALKAAPVAGNALLGAANAISDTDLSKDPGQALKQAGMGAVTGGVLGKLGGMLAPKAEEGLESFANKKMVQSLGAKPGELGVPGEEVQNMGNMAHELGLDAGSTEDKFNTAHDLVKQTGKQIEDLGQGKVLQDATPYTQNLANHAMDSMKVLGMEGNPELNMYQKAIGNLRSGATFDQLQALKNNYAARAFDSAGNIKPNGDVPFNIYKEISNAMEDMASDHPDYPELKQAYSQLMTMKEGLERQLQQEQAKGAQSSGIGMMGRMGAAITGGNVPATVGAAGLIAPAHPIWAASLLSTIGQNPAAMNTAARAIAPKIPGAVQGTTQALNDYLTSKYGKSNEPQ